MKCPICKIQMDSKSYYDSDIHMTVEEHERCVDGCGMYASEWAYGHGRERIGYSFLHNSYNDKKSRRRKMSFVRKQYLMRERRRWKKNNESTRHQRNVSTK